MIFRGLFIVMVWLLTACTAGDQFSGKSSPDDDRPSEDGEEVPGYLTYFEDITLEANGDGATISAPAGVVIVNSDSLSIQISHPEGSCIANDRLGVEILGSVPVAADGSFSGDIALVDTDKPVVLSVGENGKEVKLLRDNKLVTVVNFRDGEGFRPIRLDCEEDGDIVLQEDTETEFDDGEVVVEDDSLPGVVDTEDLSAFDLTTQAGCTDASRYWNPKDEQCETEHRLVNLQHCWPNPNGTQLKSLVANADYTEAKDHADKIADDLRHDYEVYRCYRRSPTEIQLIMTKRSHVQSMTIPYAPFTDFITE